MWLFVDDQVVGHLLRSLSRVLLRVTLIGERLQYPVNLSPFICVFSSTLNLFVTCGNKLWKLFQFQLRYFTW